MNTTSWCDPGGVYGFRFVTHYWITRQHVDQIVAAMRDLLTNADSKPRAQGAAD